ncbi:hypothetical protein [Paracoccus saliphilus]|uniref:Hemolysin-type calcium-binding repeat-containing protein n=1 Tax=Paracoccus saliphilus TaxID=405559 RepID=A0AA45W4X0_9RHOB|nr:hypothetical protein [Paracoccus saliphilus]WCR04708.1 hypothetical protein JHX88_08320 [Paracoccus saliphilus]SIS88651.1 hypothetical protein SAMN05421772_107175 [Paracoccus saliphilus]
MANAGAHLNIINIQVRAEDKLAQDKASGVFVQNREAFDKHYLAFGDHQVQPLGYTPAMVERLAAALPAVNTFRIGFNENAFDGNGNLHADYEAFLQDSLDNGKNLIFTYAGYGAAYLGEEKGMTAGRLEKALDGEYLDRLQTGWTRFGDWLERNPEMKPAIVGLEIMNEPASYAAAADLAKAEGGPGLAHYTGLYAEHMSETAAIIDGFYDGDIYVGAWGWSAQFEPLAETGENGVSVIDRLRADIGEDLVWSVHHYPGWGNIGGSSSAEREQDWAEFISVVDGDPIVLTETNSFGETTNHPDSDHAPDFQYSRMLGWFAENDIAVAWFPGANTGGSGLAYIGEKGEIEIRHQDSYAAAMNAFTADSDLEGDGEVQVIDARLRNEKTASDHDPESRFDPVEKLGLGLGSDGDDRIIGTKGANNFLYGQDGDDVLIGADHDDYLYGQGGDDRLIATGAISVLDGGGGGDVLKLGGEEVIATGSAGNDSFVLDGAQRITIADFEIDRDVLSVGDLFADLQEFESALEVVPGETDDHPGDLLITAPDGTIITILMGGNLAIDPSQWVKEFLAEDGEPDSGQDDGSEADDGKTPDPRVSAKSVQDVTPEDEEELPLSLAPAEMRDESGGENGDGEDDSDDSSGGMGGALAGLGLAGALLVAALSGGMS